MQTITCKLRLPVIVTMAIGIINVVLVFVLLNVTDMGVLAVKIVSSVLLMFKVLVFTPMYAAKNLNVKLTEFYPTILRGTVANGVMLGVFAVIASFSDVNSWTKLVIMVGICGVLGYVMNYVILLKKKEKNIIKGKATELIHKISPKKA